MYPPNFIWSHQMALKLSLAFSILGLYVNLSSSSFLVNSCWPRRRRSFFLFPIFRINRLRRKSILRLLYCKKQILINFKILSKRKMQYLTFFKLKQIKSNYWWYMKLYCTQKRQFWSKKHLKMRIFYFKKTLLNRIWNFYSMAEQCFDMTSSKQHLTFQDSFGRIIFWGKKRPKKKTSSGPQLISPNLENHANKPAIIHSFYCAKGCSQSCP